MFKYTADNGYNDIKNKINKNKTIKEMRKLIKLNIQKKRALNNK